MTKVDLDNRKLTITKEDGSSFEVKEFEVLGKKFLEGTKDTYTCELVFLEHYITENAFGSSVDTKGKIEIKPFMRRVNKEMWLEEFDETIFYKLTE